MIEEMKRAENKVESSTMNVESKGTMPFLPRGWCRLWVSLEFVSQIGAYANVSLDSSGFRRKSLIIEGEEEREVFVKIKKRR